MKNYRYRLSALAALAVMCLSNCTCTKEKEKDSLGPLVLECAITSNTTLTDHNPNGIDYIVDCDLEVQDGLLTIEPGVTIEFRSNASLQVWNKGALAINGTADKRVSLRGFLQQPCWDGLSIGTDDVRNRIRYCDISYAGNSVSFFGVIAGFSYDEKAAVAVYGRLSMENSSITHSGGLGIAYTSDAVISGFNSNEIGYCANYPVILYGGSLDGSVSMSNSSFPGNATPYICFYGSSSNSEISNDAVIHESPLPYLVYETVTFAKNLTVHGGVTIVSQSDEFLETSSTHFVKLLGSADKPVILRGKTALAGYWRGISVRSFNAENTFNHVQIQDCGSRPIGWAASAAGITVEEGRLTLNNCNITNYNDCQVYKGSSSQLTNNSPLITLVCE